MTDRIGRHIVHHEQSFSLPHGSGHAVLQTDIILICHHQLVYHHLHIMILVAVQLHARQCLAYLTVYPHIEVALLAHLFKQFLVVAFAVSYQRSQQVNPLSLILLQNQIQYLLFGVLHHLLARQVGISFSGTGKQQSQVVVHLRRRTYGRTRILVGRLLFDGDDRTTLSAESRTQPRYLVHIGPLQVAQKVAGVCRKGLYISALPLCIDGIEGQRRFSAAAEAGNHRQAVARDFHVHILQVMHPGSVYTDMFCFFLHHLLSCFFKIAKIHLFFR